MRGPYMRRPRSGIKKEKKFKATRKKYINHIHFNISYPKQQDLKIEYFSNYSS